MSKTPETAAGIEQAKRNAANARARIETTVGALKQRLSPSNLASEAKDKVRETTSAIGDRASDAVRKRPIAASAAASVAALILLRKPIGKVHGALTAKRRRREAEADALRRSEDTIRAGEPPKPSITPRIKRAVSEANAAALSKE